MLLFSLSNLIFIIFLYLYFNYNFYYTGYDSFFFDFLQLFNFFNSLISLGKLLLYGLKIVIVGYLFKCPFGFIITRLLKSCENYFI